MKNRKLITLFSLMFMLCSFIFSKDNKANVVCSTSWSGAFAELAGAEDVTVIAPANLRHPPEYEITVSDVLSITNSDYFIYAGFERMMKTLEDSFASSNTVPIQIKLDNSLTTVTESCMKIAKKLGTEKQCEKNIKEYEKVLKDGNKQVSKKGLDGAKVFCHKHQVYLAKELGLDVVATFGPGPVTSKQILDAKKGSYDLIIDNIHNPVGEPLVEVAKDAKYIIWRNFPESSGRNSLINLIKENIDVLFK